MKPDFALLFWILSIFFCFWTLATGELMPLAIGLMMSIMGMLIERRNT